MLFYAYGISLVEILPIFSIMRKKIIIEKKTITAPVIINELESISNETGKKFCTIAYEVLVEWVLDRIKQREMSDRIINDKLTLNSLKFEVNRILDKYHK